MRKIPLQFLALWRQLGLNQRVSLALSVAVVIAGVAGLVVWSNRPRMQMLYGRLSAKDAAEVVAAVQAQGVSYEIGAGGTAIYVAADKVYSLRMQLAAKGLPGNDGIGFEIFDKSDFGMSDFVQHTNYLRAVQGELARTIGQLNGVRSARVMVVMPENKLLLVDNKTRPTASVFIDQGAGSLSAEAVNAIRFLVANSVEGVRVDDVAVVDSMGNVLSERLRDGDGTFGAAAGQMRLRKNLEEYFSGKVETMLARVVGAGNAVVRVSADVNPDASTTTQEKFDPDGQVVRNQTTTEESTLGSEGKPAGNGAGVVANTPARTASGDAGGDAAGLKKTEETRKSQTQTYEVSKATISTTKAPGDIRRLTAAVFVALRAAGTGPAARPDPRTPEEMKALRAMVANALGISAAAEGAAGQEPAVSVQEIAFPAVPAAGATPMAASGAMDVVRPWITLAVAALIVVFFLRQLKRTPADAIPLELLDPANATAMLDHAKPAGLLRDRVRDLRPVSPEMLNDMIRQKPDNVSATLREWMTEKP